jgi:DtxR family Mn-dependent transcriptional regulator
MWELFLVQELKFRWDEVHDIAEQLEHIVSDTLIEKLDTYLGNPKFDPHGDPIPDVNGNFSERKTFPLSELALSSKAIMTGVIDHSSEFLRHIEDIGMSIGKEIKMVKRFDYDHSCNILLKQYEIHISNDVAKNILVSEKNK